VRFHYHTVVAQELEQIPQAYRLYLGGQDNIRGFARNAINNETLGHKTTSHIAIESRFTSLLAYGLEPFIFYDMAKASLEEFHLTNTTYNSPGICLRFESPIGNFRLSFANGDIESNTEKIETGWNAHFSYGREF
jgi:outer membrane translocation and assembly module TamA